MYYGYMRVSSSDQNEERQYIELKRFGIADSQIYCDKLSGKDFNRPQYRKLRRRIKDGDVLVVKSIDRLGRNYKDIQEEWRFITKEKKADILILDMPLLDTRTNKDLIGTLIADIVLQLLSYVAETERENIRQRQAEGIAAARARGVHFGRKKLPVPNDFIVIYELWESKKIKPKEAFRLSGMNRNQFYWMVKKHRENMNIPKRKNEKHSLSNE